jgi:hypothetical protein
LASGDAQYVEGLKTENKLSKLQIFQKSFKLSKTAFWSLSFLKMNMNFNCENIGNIFKNFKKL